MSKAHGPDPPLQGKFLTPPLPRDFVPRERLYGKLTAGFRSKLTLLSAPPGFGKTVLVSDWVQKKRVPAAWLSLDADDSDPMTFLSDVIRTIQGVLPQAGRAALAMIDSPQLIPPETVLTALLNDLQSFAGRLALVLDDYQQVDNPSVQGLMNFFLRHLPSSLHVVISTRSDPPLPLARLRSCGEVVDIRAQDLAFTGDESLRFFHQLPRLKLEGDDILRLAARTEGWIAGLKMTAISLGETKDQEGVLRALMPANRYIADYLMEETLNSQPESVVEFLIKTSILQRLSGPLCDAVTSGRDGQAFLEALEKANLFLFPIDRERTWFRYHQLFADLLRHRLSLRSSQDVAELHRRAAGWLARSGLTGEAIEHALEAGEFRSAAELMDGFAGSLWDRALQFQLLAWFNRLPKGFISSWPALALYEIRALVMSGRFPEAEDLLASVESRLEEDGELSPKSSPRWKGRLDALRGFLAMYRGEYEQVHLYASRALQTLPEEDTQWRCVAAGTLSQSHSWTGDGQLEESRNAFLEAERLCRDMDNPYFELFVRSGLALTELQQGRVPGAQRMAEDLVAYAVSKDMGRTGLASSAYALLGQILYEKNDQEEGLSLLMKSLEIAAESRDMVALAGNRLALLAVLADLGNDSDAEQLLRDLEKQAATHPLPPWLRSSISSARGAALLRSGDVEAAAAWARDRKLDAEAKPHQRREKEYEVLTGLFLAQGRAEAADRLAKTWGRAADAGHRLLASLSFRTLRSLALAEQGMDREALDELRSVLGQAEKAGLFRTLMGGGPELHRLLEKLLAGYRSGAEKFSKDYLLRVMKAKRSIRPVRTSVLKPKTLSEREVDILRLLKAGLSNQEIADSLFISLNTVRTHTKNIHIKLGAHSRTQALARAKERGIL